MKLKAAGEDLRKRKINVDRAKIVLSPQTTHTMSRPRNNVRHFASSNSSTPRQQLGSGNTLLPFYSLQE